jgi:hypothetical protein
VNFGSGLISSSKYWLTIHQVVFSFTGMNKFKSIRILKVCLFLILPFLLYCGSVNDNIRIPAFDGQRAFEYLEKQVAFGPRVPGSDNSFKCRRYLAGFFDNLGARVDSISFIHNDKISGKPILMTNIIASFDGYNKDDRRILLAAHYDSRPRAEYDPDSTRRNEWIDGANDGASGVAVLMELANMLAEHKAGIGIDMIMLDGEDYGRPGDLDEYFLGAKDFVLRDIKGKYEFALVIDMIGDKDLKIYREEHSNKFSPEITDRVWKTAASLGEKCFVDSVKHAIYDDHLSFMTIKLQAAVIIDFDYKYWHTTADTPDKCSPASLKSVGRVVSHLIYEL